jgi:hypothetical protein
MSRHVSSEALSAFLDGESAGSEGPAIAFHLASCAACRSRLDSMRRLVRGLGRLTPVAPPADLERRVRDTLAARTAMRPADAAWGVAAQPVALSLAAAPPPVTPGRGAASALPLAVVPVSPLAPIAPLAPPPSSRPARGGVAADWLASARRVRAWWARVSLPRFSGPPRLAGAPLGVGLAFLLTLVVLQYGGGSGGGGGLGVLHLSTAPAASGSRGSRPEFRVSEFFGDAPVVPPQTTSEVAGRVFVLSDDVWVQRGLDATDTAQPHALVSARSPRGRRLLARYSDLGVLLADGSRVVLRDHLQTLELSNDS